ncbi:aldo/keto reductase [Reinekea blandensis]|uniref:Aldose reductase n=1 Tax=Reinekea blandensis MED297 TaxID=314283 RepID=A4BJT1_9GAMM|nr:aldo/keto reductase [Reinekea blandensis]EAR07598.1 aldose reductase [Reinekea sp. MED297] [Reinekea blandensis MED297]
MILSETYTLSNGVEIPKLGLGTWFIDNKSVGKAICDAVDLGYRHIDTAQAYRNEQGVGVGIQQCGVNRDEIFVTTKLAAEAKTYKKAAASIDRSLSRMGLDYLDMMIIHSPQPWTKFGKAERFFEGNREAWRALEDAYRAGKLRAIGVSNFDETDLQNILNGCSVKPMVNQILAHIGNTPDDLIRYTQAQGILVEAYSPIGHGAILENPDIKAVAERYGVSVPQLAIRYDLQLGLLPIPKTANPDHMKSNAQVDFIISDDDMALLQSVEKITDYGDANAMPVFGGELNLKTMMGFLLSSLRRKKSAS